jgi:predicted enzyme related to lactoylglutathione lyase
VSDQRVGWPIWVGVVVEDFEAQRSFYSGALGLREMAAGDGWAWFDMGWPNMFEIVKRSEAVQYERARYQVGFMVGDIHTARAELISRGARPLTEVDGGPELGGLWCYFRDAEGNVFSINQRFGPPWPPAP